MLLAIDLYDKNTLDSDSFPVLTRTFFSLNPSSRSHFHCCPSLHIELFEHNIDAFISYQNGFVIIIIKV